MGLRKSPVDTFNLWALVKNGLDTRHEKETIQVILDPLAVITDKPKLNKDTATKPTAPPLYEDTKKEYNNTERGAS
jgi:hypothetical protein